MAASIAFYSPHNSGIFSLFHNIFSLFQFAITASTQACTKKLLKLPSSCPHLPFETGPTFLPRAPARSSQDPDKGLVPPSACILGAIIPSKCSYGHRTQSPKGRVGLTKRDPSCSSGQKHLTSKPLRNPQRS